MMAWICDRCGAVVNSANRKNQRPDGWITVRRQPTADLEAENWLLCCSCQKVFYEAVRDISRCDT